MTEATISSRTDIKESLGSPGSEGVTGRHLEVDRGENIPSEIEEFPSAYQEWIQAPARLVVVASISFGEVVKGVYVRSPSLDEPLVNAELASEFSMFDEASNADFWTFEEGLE